VQTTKSVVVGRGSKFGARPVAEDYAKTEPTAPKVTDPDPQIRGSPGRLRRVLVLLVFKFQSS
jgi:hypothetical protein